MAQKNVLSLDEAARRIYRTEDSLATVLADKYFNPYRREIEVDEVITVLTGTGRKQIIVTQVDPFVTTAVYEDDGIRNDIIALQSGLGAPVISTPTVDSATFNVAAIPNSLTVVINIVTNFECDKLVRDTASTPAASTVGEIVTWTGLRSTTSTITNYTEPEPVYMWVRRKSDSVWIQCIPDNPDNADTNNGYVVQGIDNTKPLVPVLALSAGTDTDTQVNYSITNIGDVGAGIKNVSLYNSVNSLLYRDLGAISTTSTTGTISGLSSGQTLALYALVTDNADNVSQSDEDAITTTTTAAAAGSISFTAVEYTAAEDDASPALTAVLDRPVASGDSGYIQVTVSTVDRVAEAVGGLPYAFNTTTGVNATTDVITLASGDPWVTGDPVTYSKQGGSATPAGADATTYYVNRAASGQYSLHATYDDAIAGTPKVALTSAGAETQYLFDGANVAYEKKVNEVVSWADTVSGNKNVTIMLVNRSSAYHNKFEIQIDAGSNTEVDGVTPIGTIGAQDACLGYITSSATGTEGYQVDANGNIVINLNSTNCTFVNSTRAGATSDAWSLISPSSRAASNDNVKPNNTKTDYGTATTIDTEAPRIDVKIVTGNFDYTVWARMYRNNTVSDRVHLDIDSGGVATLKGMYSLPYTSAPVLSAQGWAWTKVDSTSTDRTTGVLTAAQHTLSIYQGPDYQAQVDAIVLTAVGSGYDPSLYGTDPGVNDDPVGPAESTYGTSATAIDNPSNPSAPGVPAPTSSVAATSLFPYDGKTGVTVAPTPRIVLPLTQIVVDTFTVTVNGGAATGSYVIGNDDVTWTFSSTLPNSATVVINASGAGIDSGGSKSWTVTNWTFTTLAATGAGTTLLSANFTNRSVGTYTEAMARADFQVDTYGPVDSFALGDLAIVADPANSGRGNVLQSTHQPNTFGGGPRFRGSFQKQAQADHIFLAYDLYWPSSNDNDIGVVKMPILMTGTMTEASHFGGGAAPDSTLVGEVSFGLYLAMYGTGYWDGVQTLSGPRAMAIYEYSDEVQKKERFFNTTDPTVWLGSAVPRASVYAMPLDRWITYELECYMGTPGNTDAWYKVWITDPARWAGAKLVLDRSTTPLRMLAAGSTMAPDGLWISNFYGGSNDAFNKASKTNVHLFDNFIVSTSAITH